MADAPEDDRSWMDSRADQQLRGNGPHRGRGPQGWKPSDQWIQEEICERLTNDRLIDARGIEVAVAAGVVTLRGATPGASDPVLAGRIAREVPGVAEVRSELEVHEGQGSSMPRQDDEHGDDRTDRSPLGYPILPT